MEIKMLLLFQEICVSYESLMKHDHLKDPITALRLMKFLILKKGLSHFYNS